jgi:hypothetical protein
MKAITVAADLARAIVSSKVEKLIFELANFLTFKRHFHFMED